MKQYLVIKCGGSVFEKLTPSFFKSIQQIQREGIYAPIIVHGGGPAISKMLKRMNIPTTFHDGLRFTSQEVLAVAERVLSGSMNKKIVENIQSAGGKAAGLSGIDGQLFSASPINLQQLGYVGRITAVDPSLIQTLCKQNVIPVISPISADAAGQHYNINADQAASAIAGVLKSKLCFISDVSGILIEDNGELKRMAQISNLQIQQLIEEKKISGGMIPKVLAAVESLKQQVPEVVIVSGMMPECLIDYTKGRSVGTKIFLGEEVLHA